MVTFLNIQAGVSMKKKWEEIPVNSTVSVLINGESVSAIVRKKCEADYSFFVEVTTMNRTMWVYTENLVD